MSKPKLETVEIVASYTGKIPTGPYENESPFFSLKEVYSGKVTDEFINHRQRCLHDQCYLRFMSVEERSKAEKILRQRSDLRFYDVDGAKFPSVTSVVGWDDDFYMDPVDLSQYAARGTILHRQAEIFLEKSEWLDPQDIDDVYPEYVIVKRGNLGLKLDDVNFRGWFKKYPFEHINLEEVMINREHKYAGRRDIKAIFGDRISVMDIKTGSSVNREKAFKQMAAYAKADPDQNIEQLVIIHLNNKTKRGFSAPIVTDNIEKYWQLFLKDRQTFKQRFGI